MGGRKKKEHVALGITWYNSIKVVVIKEVGCDEFDAKPSVRTGAILMSDKRLERIFNRRSTDQPAKRRFFKGIALDTITTRFFVLFLVFVGIPLFAILLVTYSIIESQVDLYTTQQLQVTKQFYKQHLKTQQTQLHSVVSAMDLMGKTPVSSNTFFDVCHYYALDMCLDMSLSRGAASYFVPKLNGDKTAEEGASIQMQAMSAVMQDNPELAGWLKFAPEQTGFIHFEDNLYLVRALKYSGVGAQQGGFRLLGFQVNPSNRYQTQLNKGLLSVWTGLDQSVRTTVEPPLEDDKNHDLIDHDSTQNPDTLNENTLEQKKNKDLYYVASVLQKRKGLSNTEIETPLQVDAQTSKAGQGYLVSTMVMGNYADEPIDHVLFVMPLDVKDKIMSGYYEVFYLITIASIILSLVLAFVGGRPITQPLLKLVAQVNRLSRSSMMDEEIEVQGVYEINELVGAFNRMLKRLNQEQQLRDEFVATLTHDLKVPLLAEKQTLAYLNKGTYGDLNDEQQEVVSLIQSTNQDSLGLVNGLLEVYRYESGQVRLNFDPVDVPSLLASTASELAPLAQEKKIEIIYDDSLAQTNDDSDKEIASSNVVSVLGDRVELKRVFQNIISNAIANTSNKGCITLSAQHAQVCGADYIQQLTAHQHSSLHSPIETNNKVIVRIDDTGIGISREDMPHLFSRFAASKGRNPMSIGLGLYNAFQVVKAHGGQLWVETTEGEGTSVLMALPEEPDVDTDKSDAISMQSEKG